MFASLGKIKNPALRIITGASAAFSLVTIVAAVVIGFTNPKAKSAQKVGVYASLMAAALGGIVSPFIQDKASDKRSSNAKQKSATDDRVWRDWRNFEVTHKVKESKEITSFYLKPQDGGELPDFPPGQFLTIQLDIPDQPRPVIRTYSLSDYLKSGDYYRLSIKRENAPKNLDVPPGVASTFMHDRIEEGSVIPAKPPNGKFVLDVNKSVPAVLISNGVGITPMIAMAKACSRLNPSRHIWFLHGARNGEYHAFAEEVNAIAENNPNLHIHYKYSRPGPEDEGHYHSQGYVDKDLLQNSIIPEINCIYGSADAEYFLCGSPAFMDSLIAGLKELGVSEDKIFFESFSKGGKGTKAPSDTKTTTATKGEVDSAEIVFTESDKTLTWQAGDSTILEFAEANGLNPPYSCRQGICLTCMCPLKEGEVEYVEEPTGTPDEGSVLICICQPKTAKVVLEL